MSSGNPPFLSQVWAYPCLRERMQVAVGATPVRIRPARVSRDDIRATCCTLLETDCQSEDSDDVASTAAAVVGQALARLSFGALRQFSVLGARMIRKGYRRGDRARVCWWPGPPPGLGLFVTELGFRKLGRNDVAWLRATIDPQVEFAITWFVHGLSTPNPLEQLLFYWIGLEALAPRSRGRVRQSISRLLRGELGISEHEVDELYNLRCKVSHGGAGMDADQVRSVGSAAIRLRRLLLDLIKARIGIPKDEQPMIEISGVTIEGAPGIEFEDVEVDCDDFYDALT